MRSIAREMFCARNHSGALCVIRPHVEPKKVAIMLTTILIVILILALLGALPTWGYSRSWGYGPGGGIGLILIIVLILVLTGHA
jgi:hypothetical protein